MGRTVPSMTQVFYQEQASLSRFRRALRRSDQIALDDLFSAAQQHLAAAAYAAHALPFEVFLLAMLLEEHKVVLRLRSQIEDLSGEMGPFTSAPGLPEPAFPAYLEMDDECA